MLKHGMGDCKTTSGLSCYYLDKKGEKGNYSD